MEYRFFSIFASFRLKRSIAEGKKETAPCTQENEKRKTQYDDDIVVFEDREFEVIIVKQFYEKNQRSLKM